MDYSLITENDIQKRVYSVPDNLREVLNSENNVEIVRKICRSHHLNDDEKILIVEQLTGLTLMGFLHSEEMSREISENIAINKQHADDIANEINQRILSPIRSDLDRIYSPFVPPAAEIETSVIQPQPSASAVPSAPTALPQKPPFAVLPTEPSTPVIAPDATIDLRSPVDLSKLAERGSQISQINKQITQIRPEINLKPSGVAEQPRVAEQARYGTGAVQGGQTREPAIFGAGAAGISPVIQPAKAEPSKTPPQAVDIQPPKVDKRVSASMDEGPKIIHEETAFKPLTATPVGPTGELPKRSLGGLAGMFPSAAQGRPVAQSPITARINIGGQPAPVDQRESASGPRESAMNPKPRVVHYTELKTASPFGGVEMRDEKLDMRDAVSAPPEPVKPIVPPGPIAPAPVVKDVAPKPGIQFGEVQALVGGLPPVIKIEEKRAESPPKEGEEVIDLRNL